MNGKIAKNFNPVSLAAVFVLALSPDAYAEKDALISVTASSNSDASGPAFLNYAKANGAIKYQDGLGMLVGQAAVSFQLWEGVMPEVEPVLRQLKAEMSK